MKKTKLFLFGLVVFASFWACKDQPPVYTISGRILDGTTNYRFSNLTFEVFNSDRIGNPSKKIGNFTTNDSGDFTFKYKKSDGNSLMLLNGSMKFKYLAINKDIHQYFYKSTLGKYSIKCDCPNIKITDTLFLEFPKIMGNDLVRGIDTITRINHGDTFNYRSFPLEEFSVAWGINHSNFKWEWYQNNILIKQYQGKIRGNITGDPVINEFILKY